ncbi:THAP domain-containing protein 3 [Conger conger]|uniref:THAP domain-containing protein 3 n=1 Tax=Conger conger TaxID=82655 RepID=UPI002A5ADACF|nr:THAP domain-containing protein 3 [Conger conger]
MPKSCSAYNCTNRYSNKNPDLTFHRFPFSKPSVLKEWLHNIGREDFQPKRHMVICSEHFSAESFSGLGNRKNLLWNAVPTLFTFPASPSKRRKSKKRLKEDVTLGFQKWEEMLPGETDGLSRLAPEDAAAPDSPGEDKLTAEQQLSPRSQGSGPSDHSGYTLPDPCEAKTRLFRSLDANRQLRKRLKVKGQVIRRLRAKLRETRRKLASVLAGRGRVRNPTARGRRK